MDNNELITLIKKSQEGDAAAMEELLRAAYAPVSYQCRRFLKTGADAEDMTQEILLLVYTKIGTLHEPAAFWGWLGRMTANRCKNALTRTHTDLPILEDEDGNSALDAMEDGDRQAVPEEAFDNAETARMIGGIVDALPDAQRDCILLYYYDEMSVKEIAEAVGASENTVKSRLSYARKTIRENVLDYEEKQGIRLHSLAPIPLLLYFLRMDAEAGVDSQKAVQAASRAMEQGAAASAAPVSGAATSAARSAASNVLKGISIKTAAVAGAGLLLIGGAAAGIAAIFSHDKEETDENSTRLESSAPVEAVGPAAGNAPEPITDEAETQEGQLFPAEALAALPYTGDTGQCAMTMAQAGAFAAVLEECLRESQSEEFQYEAFADNLDLGFIDREEIESRYTTSCMAAMFDAGDGIPALWVTEAYEENRKEGLFWYSTFKIYCWNGTQAVLMIDGSNAGNGNPVYNCNLTEQGLLLGCSGPVSSENGLVMYSYSELYDFSGGMIAEAPAHVLECFTVEDSPSGNEEKVKAYISQYGRDDLVYATETLTEDKWVKDADELSPMVRAAAVDGNFIQPDSVFGKELGHVFWEYAGEDSPLGQGQHLYTGIDKFYWAGDWMDAEELAALLRNAGGGTAADTATGTETSAPEDAAASVDGDIRRTAIDSRGYDIEIWYEIPAFPENTGGYKKINAEYEARLDAFVQDESGELADLWEIVEANPPVSESYRYTVSAEIKSHTAQYVSVEQCFSMYLGGMDGTEYYYDNYRTDTGERLLLTDLLEEPEGRIKEMIAEALAQADPYTEETGVLNEIKDRDIGAFDFYIADGHIYVCFTPYDLYGMSYGDDAPVEVELAAGLRAEWR